MNSFINIIEKTLGAECSPALVVAAQKADGSTLSQISEASNAFDQAPYAHEISKEYGDLVPYLPVCFSKQFQQLNGYMGMTPEDLDSAATVRRAIESLKPMLLYCHAVAIDDPGAFLLGSFHDSDEANYQMNRQRFINYLEFIVTIKPLLDAGAIILLPKKATMLRTPSMYPDSHRPGDYNTFQIDFAGVKILAIQEMGALLSERELLKLLPHAESYLWAMTKVSAAHAGVLDYYLPQDYWHSVLKEMLEAAGKQMCSSHVQAPGLFAAPPLIDLHIPNLEVLSCGDVIRLRTSEPAFERWRVSLNEALSMIKSIDGDDMKKRLDEPCDDMVVASMRLEDDISDSLVMGKAVRGTKQFTIGAVTASVADSMVLEALTSQHARKPNAFGELLIERKKQEPENSVLNFFVSIL